MAVTSELAPNSRRVRTEVGWGEAMHDHPGEGGPEWRFQSGRPVRGTSHAPTPPNSTTRTPVLLHSSHGPPCVSCE